MFALCSCLFLYITTAYTYENIALGKLAFQQFPYPVTIVYTAPLIQASNAVDGLKSNLSIWGGQCVISANKQQTATWWVNLTSILSMHHITVYYRTENSEWGPAREFASRFLGFSLYVSNTTYRSDGMLCFKEMNFTLNTIPPVFNITCPVHGQYVIYYNERLSGVSYPSGYSEYAFNELCELEVYGCPLPGYFGSNCSIPCPDPHCRYCHIETGTCQGCKPGYQGHGCELECADGFYGDGCLNKCGHCSELTQCSHVDGRCLSGCKPGYKGNQCMQMCDTGTFGVQCNESCGNCKDNSTCVQTNGTCSQGCQAGYRGDLCKTGCPHGFYGTNCANKCSSTCKDCNAVNGLCETGCYPGWKGVYCQEKCAGGFYSDNCSRTCGKCSDGESCHHINGTCLQGCKTGYQLPLCTEECQNSTYGTNCSESCGKCRDSSQCHLVNGSCLEGCDPGYQGEKCITECDFGYYGFRCLHECSTFCKSSRECHHVTGSCIDGCKSGWQGNDCLEVLKSEDCTNDGNANFYGMLGAFCLTLVLIGLLIAYIIVTRRKKTESATKYQHNEQAKPMENRYHEMYENEAVNSGYQELGEFNKESTTYSTLSHVDAVSVLR